MQRRLNTRNAAQLSPADLRRGAEYGVGRMLLSMALVLLLALALAYAESRAPSSAGPVPVGSYSLGGRWAWD